MTAESSTPVLTVLMPLKDCHAPYLTQSIDSVRAQTSENWRLLVIVERRLRGDLAEILKGLDRDARSRVIVNEGSRLAGAINTAMRRATTPFVAVLLADDLWASNAVEVLERQICLHPDGDFFHSSRRIVNDHGAPVSTVHSAKVVRSMDDFVGQTPVKHLLCWRRELALSIGGLDESVRVGPDDMDFPWSMAEAGARFVTVPDCLYVYRDHRQGVRITTHLPLHTHLRQLRRVIRKHGVSREICESWVAEARATYLRQCLYRSTPERWLKRWTKRDPENGWRDIYS